MGKRMVKAILSISFVGLFLSSCVEEEREKYINDSGVTTDSKFTKDIIPSYDSCIGVCFSNKDCLKNHECKFCILVSSSCLLGCINKHYGKCIPTAHCKNNKECGKSGFCKHDGKCNYQSSDIWSCEPIPNVCHMISSPVCGCDNKTYGNECIAHSKGISVHYKGKCK